MDNKIKSLFNKMKPNKRYLPLFGLHSKYLLIILFLTLFMKSKEQNEIKVVVNGNGQQTFLVGVQILLRSRLVGIHATIKKHVVVIKIPIMKQL